MWEQTQTMDYQELIDFFNKEYLSQDIITELKDKLFESNNGYLVADEIVILKSKRGKSKFVKKRYKSTGGYVVPGVSIVLLLWTDGNVRIPIRFKLQLNGEKHTDSLLELLSWYRNKISKKIKYVLFDSGFTCYKILKRVDDYGWWLLSLWSLSLVEVSKYALLQGYLKQDFLMARRYLKLIKAVFGQELAI